jgi:hypothetical protein
MVVIAQPGEVPVLRIGGDVDERAARRSLRDQIARLERDLAEAVVSAFPHAMITAEDARVSATGGPRLLDIGELEELRDDLAIRLRTARRTLAERSVAQQEARERLEAMLLAPGKHRFAQVSNASLGEGGCGVWAVRPRLGLIGMLMGWWHVKLSSGCPLRPGRVQRIWGSAHASAAHRCRRVPPPIRG